MKRIFVALGVIALLMGLAGKVEAARSKTVVKTKTVNRGRQKTKVKTVNKTVVNKTVVNRTVVQANPVVVNRTVTVSHGHAVGLNVNHNFVGVNGYARAAVGIPLQAQVGIVYPQAVQVVAAPVAVQTTQVDTEVAAPVAAPMTYQAPVTAQTNCAAAAVSHYSTRADLVNPVLVPQKVIQVQKVKTVSY